MSEILNGAPIEKKSVSKLVRRASLNAVPFDFKKSGEGNNTPNEQSVGRRKSGGNRSRTASYADSPEEQHGSPPETPYTFLRSGNMNSNNNNMNLLIN